MTEAVVATLAVAGTAALVWISRHDHRRARARRWGFFKECHGLLDHAELRQDGVDYPILSGHSRGHRIEIRALADTIALRKLPVLWLLVTIHRPLQVAAHFDMMLRPDNSEYYSAHAQLPEWVPTPAHWPQEAVLRTDNPAETMARVIPALSPHVARFTAELRGKEIFLSPKGVRLVYRVDEAERGHYLLTRQPHFDCGHVPRAMVEGLLNLGHDIADSLAEAA